MPSYYPPKKNTAYVFYRSLVAQATPETFQADPTLAIGDFKVSIDGGALNNLTNIPVTTPAASKIVKFSMTAAEMNGDDILIIGSDAAGAEWNDIFIELQTTASQLDDVATGVSDIQSRIPTALTVGGNIKADVLALSGDAPAADNAESFFDGTGYAGTNNTIPTVTTITNPVTAGTVSDKTGYSLAAGGIGSGATAAAELNNIADSVLDRVMSAGVDSGADNTTSRTVRQALFLNRNKVTIAGGVMTVKKCDDTTTSWTATMTTAAGDPITSQDPT